MVKLQEVRRKFSITIPHEIIKLKKWRKGQEIVLGFDHEGNIILKEIK